jgi:RimJ/RimL family protein N-acetyltransferase
VEILETGRLVLRRPRQVDEPAIFSRYASDPEAGPYLVFGRDGVTLPGSAGIVNEDALRGQAGVHVDHRASYRVLEKAGFVRESIRAGRPSDFPNLPSANRDAAIYTLTL